jgi:hypothetical protein
MNKSPKRKVGKCPTCKHDPRKQLGVKKSPLKFYDVGQRKSIMLTEYTIQTIITNGKNGKRRISMACGKGPKGNKVCRIMKNEKH